MSDLARPWRSVLYVPGSNPRAIEKVRSTPCDAVILDLEDAVAPAQKEAARTAVVAALAGGGFGMCGVLVRINDLGSPWGANDIAALSGSGVNSLLLPKVNGADDIARLDGLLHRDGGFSDSAVWAMVETPRAIVRAHEIAAAPKVAGLVMGTNDLAKDLRCDLGQDRAALMHALQTAVVAARAEGRIIIDGVYNAFRDEDGLRAECAQGRAFGFDGKSLIHPAQVAIANTVFAPSHEDVDLAHRQIYAYEEAQKTGQGVAVLEGRIVENLHVDQARRLIGLATAIAEREAAQ
ncbi:MAG: CoA ester lyase [Pseudomonadota bacterium]